MVENKETKKKKENWIRKDFENKIPKLDRRTIFIPRQSEMTF